MGIPVVSIMFIFLHLHCIHGSNVFTKDVSQVAGVGTAKKWLVFMEMRIKQCMKIPHGPRVELLGLIGCLITRPVSQKRCYTYKSRWAIWFQKQYGITILHKSWFSKSRLNTCRKTGSLILNVFVHGMFNIHVNFLHFEMVDTFFMYPFHHDCMDSPATITIVMNGTSYEYCGAHYPYSIYFPKNMVSLKLDTQDGPYIFPGHIHVVLEIGVVDRHIFHDKYGMQKGTMTWSDFKVRWYRITVEMLYRVMIRAVFTDRRKSILIIYDGPNENMPKLLNHNYQLNETILSSTFQIFVVRESNRRTEQSALTFKAIKDKQIVVKPSQQVFLKNNSGCGIKNTKTWMCTYHIFSPVGTHAELHIVSLDISGPYKDMYVSAGVAIYNVINQNRTLIAHWYMSIDTIDRALVITGTENELHMVVFSYSPFAVLSYHFSVDSSRCIGRFIGKFMRPSLLSIPHFSRSSSTGETFEEFLIQFNVTRECLTVQLIFLPVEYPISFHTSVTIAFSYKQALHVWKYSKGNEFMVHSCEISGDYIRVQGRIYSYTSFMEIIGMVDVVDCWSASNSIINIFEVHPNECFLPCQIVDIPIITVNGNHELCDICTYEWINNYDVYVFKYLPSYGSIKFERMYGNISSLEICIGLTQRSCCSGPVHCYFTVNTTFQFSERRSLAATIYSTDVWRTQRLSDDNDDDGENCQLNCSFPTEDPVLFRFGAYEYIPRNTFNASWLVNWSSAGYECARIGAQLLTVFDRRELAFIIQNIMIPYAIEHIFIGMQRKVRISFEEVLTKFDISYSSLYVAGKT